MNGLLAVLLLLVAGSAAHAATFKVKVMAAGVE